MIFSYGPPNIEIFALLSNQYSTSFSIIQHSEFIRNIKRLSCSSVLFQDRHPARGIRSYYLNSAVSGRKIIGTYEDHILHRVISNRNAVHSDIQDRYRTLTVRTDPQSVMRRKENIIFSGSVRKCNRRIAKIIPRHIVTSVCVMI